jgi:hypothetical protein
MAYTKPTPQDLIARFPEFTSTTGGSDYLAFIQLLIDEAAQSVDQTWGEVDYKNGIMYLAAHLLAVSINKGGVTTNQSSGSVSSGDDGLYLRQVTFGQRSISFASKTGGLFGGSNATKNADAALDTTTYGQMFLLLRRRNSPLVLVV